jgi:uncharacterized protein (TIGR03437 family)
MFRSSAAMRTIVGLLLLIAATRLPLPAANLGTVVPVVGQISDLVYDDRRDVVYLANYAENRVDVYSVSGRRIVNSISTGPQPDSLALSPDRQTLWVASQQASTLSSFNLNTNASTGEFALQSRPDAIAVGYDGKVLIYGGAGLLRFDPADQSLLQLQISPPAVPAAGQTAPANSPLPQGFRAGLMASDDGKVIVGLGVAGTGNSPPMRLFVYEVASGAVMRSRNVSGLSSVLSVAPDGSRFMAGPFLFETSRLTILGRAGYIPASNVQLTGGSVFSPDGGTVFASFATQTPINALNTNQPALTTTLRTGVIQALSGWSLTPLVGLRLPETITAKVIRSRDGANLFALSPSGFMVIPVGTLDRVPIIDVDTTNVVLTADICSRAVVTAQVQVRNLGGGRLTFTAATTAGSSAPLTIRQTAASAPAALQITFDGRRANTSALGTGQYVITLTSSDAVNVEPALLVNLNFRDVNQRGAIVPIDGLATDMLLDEPRQRLYTTNFMRDRVDVFSLPQQRFLASIGVGSQPFSMAQVNPSTLVVANSGGEYLSVVDLDAMQEVDRINMGPMPINATPQFPRSIAVSNNAILFTTMAIGQPGQAPGNGSVWQLSLAKRQAFPRTDLGNNVTNTVNGRNLLVAPANGSAIVVADASGTLRYYDPVTDSFPMSRTSAITGYRGTAAAAADGSFYVIDNTVFNSVLTQRGSLAPTTGNAQQTAAFGVAAVGADAVRVQAATSTGAAQQLQRFDLSSLQARDQFPLPEAAMDITPSVTAAAAGGGTAVPIVPPTPGGGGTIIVTPNPGGGGTIVVTPTPGGGGTIVVTPTPTTSTAASATLARVWPPSSISRLFGAQGQTMLLRDGVVVDSQNNAYLLTVSGLTIMPLATSTQRAPNFQAGGVVNGANFKGAVAVGSVISIFGTDLAGNATAQQLPLPTLLGGVCITANTTNIPLFYASPTQINAQMPFELTAGRITLTVRSRDAAKASASVAVTVSAAAPAVFTVDGKQAALFHADDFALVTPQDPGKRDKDLILFATGLGRTTLAVASGAAAGSSPLAAVSNVSVTIGGHPMIVSWAGLAPGFVGLYQINIRVPGDRVQGDALPVVVSVGSTSNTASGAAAPLTAIH